MSPLGKSVNNVLLYRHTEKIVYGLLGVAVGLCIAAYWVAGDGKSLFDWAKVVVTPTVIFSSLIITAKQFAYNREWNTKEAGVKAVYVSRGKTAKENAKIDPLLNTTKKLEENRPLTIREIHNKMGVFLKNGRFVFHGEHTDDDIRHIHENEQSGYVMQFDNRINGREVEKTIKAILNEYEYICMGCNLGIFDKDVVVELAAIRIVGTFNIFINYIYHLRYDKRHEYGKFLYNHFESMVKEIVDKRAFGLKIAPEPQECDFITPFQKRKGMC